MIVLPLTNDPEQLFSVNIFGTVYDIRVTLNSRGQDDLGLWDIGFFQGETALLTGLALLSGVDIINPHILGFDHMFIVNIEDQNTDPNSDNLQSSCRLVILTEEEFEAFNVSTV